ncbi:DHA2 family efflux MFS transporter permease subunit [Zavarzinia compransoris]|uniref:MFS transporter n=1 Tax=Zavarzinia compransoris TaxID=1264899 RepID=A0A317E8K1_9PROT|nr:DHA2 family efflux MFS transporter permease subunit [Zavarzinia compransoris]PWR23041.1 MFS transporter [Zavarzinia compransoris]TDP46414.1 EmrB/QacA subfamily drug resistance transporter [Zavarzinia compransoris]
MTGADETGRGPPGYRTIALIIAAALFMEQLDITILATALPAMARDFGTSAPNLSLALTAYMLSLAIFIPVSGVIADRFGTLNVFRVAIVVFTLGSALCSLAEGLASIVAARLLQGLGGAMMMPVGRLILLRAVDKKDMVAATAWLLVPALVGPIVGPPLGGFIVTYLDWRWIFYINVPIGLLGIVLSSLYIPNLKVAPAPGQRFDLAGMILSGIALGGLFFGAEMASREGEGRVAVGLVALGLVFGALYLRHARRHPSPILDVSLLRVETFRLSMVAGSLARITQGAHPFLLPLMFQLSFGLSAAEAGGLILATALGATAMKACAPYLLRRFGFRDCLTVNGVLSSLTYGACAFFTPDWPHGAILLVLFCSGFSMSLQFTAYNTIAYDEIGPERMSSATSFYTTFQQLMLSAGVCAAAAVLHIALALGGRDAQAPGDFSAAFLVVTGISLLATLWNRRFAPDAGSDISGHHLRDR